MPPHGSILKVPRTKSILVIFVLASHCLAAASGAEQVRTVVPRATLNYLSIPVAEAKGFFRDQGLENQTIVIPGSTAIAALVSGNVDYSGAGGSGMRAALRGAPIKAVMFQTEKVTWYLLAASDIQKIFLPLRSEIFCMSEAASKYHVTFSV